MLLSEVSLWLEARTVDCKLCNVVMLGSEDDDMSSLHDSTSQGSRSINELPAQLREAVKKEFLYILKLSQTCVIVSC